MPMNGHGIHHPQPVCWGAFNRAGRLLTALVSRSIVCASLPHEHGNSAAEAAKTGYHLLELSVGAGIDVN